MESKKFKIIIIVLIILLIIIGSLIIWFKIPYSPLKSKFEEDVSQKIKENSLNEGEQVFTKEEFDKYPSAIQKYIEKCGYIGKQKMSYLKMEYNDVDFMQGLNGPKLKIDYTQYDYVKNPDRLAFIDSSMFGIPFQGYDYYADGKGGMEGVIAKTITLFDQTGKEMDQACLITFLAESLFAPNILLQDYIYFEEIDDFNVKATIDYNGISASGIFTFNEEYEMIRFSTNDRHSINKDGSIENVKWSAVCSDYEFADSGIKYPTYFKAIWNYPDKDFIYFDGKISKVSYGY